MFDPYILESTSPTDCKAWLMNGTDEYIEIPDSDTLSFGNGTTDSPFSITAWVYMHDSSRFQILNKFEGSNREYLFNTITSKKLLLVLYDSSISNTINRYCNVSMAAYENQWAHVTATYDGSSSSSGIKLYINGNRVDTSTTSTGSYTAMHNTSARAFVGLYEPNNWYADGKIDQLTVWNKELSSTEITNVYSGDLSGLTGNIISGWNPANTVDGSGGVVDSYGSNNGTLINMTVADNVVDC